MDTQRRDREFDEIVARLVADARPRRRRTAIRVMLAVVALGVWGGLYLVTVAEPWIGVWVTAMAAVVAGVALAVVRAFRQSARR
ncbi:hypothetical protein M1L60_44490 [Actinoplanes sp. TRM 88003]|uniref:Uncharacterized protein n=1 Tax=Paractinoplanes aksuensis TaxID=2939490 RepID=A0ABT1E3E7_9ACTN|nr:hypothetical protein [Actinoplanes aksuensis]MCO8277659.1 hypothetical protein [Actinoplanes aksuensis]